MSSITIPAHARKFYSLHCGGEKATSSMIEGLMLTSWLADRAGVAPRTIVRKTWRASKDAKRLFTGAERAEIIARDKGCCAYCGARVAPQDIKIDHIIPHAAGGQTVAANGAVACTACNLAKSSKVW